MRRRFAVLAGLAFVIWCSSLFTVLKRGQDGTNDFDTYYTAGQAVLKGEGIYYIGEQYKMREGISPFLYLPVIACFFALLAWFPLPLSILIWHTLLTASFFGVLYLSFRVLRMTTGDLHRIWMRGPKWLLCFLTVITAVILFDNLFMAQVNLIVLLLCLLTVYFYQYKKNVLAGLALSAAIVLKMTPVVFCFYFLAKRQWKLLISVLVCMVLFTLIIPLFIFGAEKNRVYHQQWFGHMLKPALIDVLPPPKGRSPEEIVEIKRDYRDRWTAEFLRDTNQSLRAAVTRWLLKDRLRYPEADPYKNLPILGGGVKREGLYLAWNLWSLAVFGWLGFVWFRKKSAWLEIREPAELSVVFLTMTLFSPITRSHYYIYWLLPFAVVFLYGVRCEQKSNRCYRALPVCAFLGAVFYAFQPLPYAEAAGTAAWGNLIFLGGFTLEQFYGRQRAH